MFLKTFFYYTKHDRIAMTVLLCVMLMAVAAIALIDPGPAATAEEYAKKEDYVRERRHYEKTYRNNWERRRSAITDATMFAFDPNTATEAELLRLGLRPWQARNVIKYRAKGGKFRRPADFAKIYGLSGEDFTVMEPYIRIASEYSQSQKTAAIVDSVPVVRMKYEPKLKEGETVLLNLADTSRLKLVPGIGSYFARRIVGYRNRLGGFVNVSQLAEIEDFPKEAIKYFIIDVGEVRKINLNKATPRQMSSHPYINYAQAKQIENYRRLRGKLNSLDELKTFSAFSAADIERLRPYVAFK